MNSSNQSTPTASMRMVAGPIWDSLTKWVINPIMRRFLNGELEARRS